MFNSIRKDDSCRKLVKSFEILRLQNKIIVQAMSNIKSNALPKTRKTSHLPETSLVNATTSGEAKAKFIEDGNLKTIVSAIAVNNDKTNSPFYNYNCFTDLELCKSSLHLFAKKRLKAEKEITKLPKGKDNNKNSSPKINTSYKTFSSALLALAKGRIISLPRNSSKSRIKNRCIETGRSHSVLRFCKLSRIRLRDNASKGLISGISKASW